MKIPFLLTAIFAFFADARENPFKSLPKESRVEASMQEINKPEKLPKIGLILPNEAVKIKKIVVEYQNLDGDSSKRSYEVEKSIEPQKPLKMYQ